jgi:hypothetical protein
MKSDLRISIKDYRRNKNLKIQLVRARFEGRRENADGRSRRSDAGDQGDVSAVRCVIGSPRLILANQDTRYARRAARESDGLNRSAPGVALSESGNPGLYSATPSVSSG